MSMEVALQAEKRSDSGKGVARKLRAAGRVPGIVYGADQDPIMVSLDARNTLHAFEHTSVENTIFALEVEGEGAPVKALVREIQMHPFKTEILHVDFLRVTAGVAVDMTVPVHLNGTPVGVKDHGGIMDHVVHDLPIRCIPSRIPDSVEIDVSHLDVGDTIHVSDIDLGGDVEILLEGDRPVCSVRLAKGGKTAEAMEEEGAEEAGSADED